MRCSTSGRNFGGYPPWAPPSPTRPPRQATPRHAMPRHAMLRHATPQQATPRQAMPRQARNNQDEEAALLQKEQVRNWTQSITTFFKIVGIFFCGIIAPVVIISLFCGCVLLSWYLLTIIIPIKCNPNLNPQCRSP